MGMPRFALSVFLLSLCTIAVAQNRDLQKQQPSPPSNAQMSFASLKALAGEWEGPVTVDPSQPEMGSAKSMHVTLRVTSRGNALVHELQEANTPLDPAKYDHPVTMLYVDNDQLNLVHYCDAGNRPHMVARKSADGKSVEFDFVDMSGGKQYGHMHHVLFTAVDDQHHSEDWTFMMPGDKPVHAHFDLHRVN